MKCPYCDYETSMSMRADVNLYQHMRDKHGLSDGEIMEALKGFRQTVEKIAWERFKCPRCGERNFFVKIKCVITANVKEKEVVDWNINRIFYTTIRCNRCGSEEFCNFEELPTGIKSQILKL